MPKELINALLSARITAERIERKMDQHWCLVVHGDLSGCAIVNSVELSLWGIDCPDERLDVD